MADAIGQVLSFAVVVAISPVPIIAVVLILATPRGRVNGPAFLVGWFLGLSVVGVIVLLASNGIDATSDDGPAAWVSWLKIVLGLLLVVLAVRQWRGRPQGDEDAPMPGWMRTIDRFTPTRSAAMGVALSAINPKNLLMTVAAATAIAQSGESDGVDAAALAVFVVIGTLGPGVPVAISLAMGARGRELLDGLKVWMGAHNAAIMSVMFLVIGAKLAGDGISGLGS